MNYSKWNNNMLFRYMAKTRFKFIKKKLLPYVICDSNVWYSIASGNYSKPDDALLIPTIFSLAEINSSTMMTKNLKYFQDVIKKMRENSGPIIPRNPLDFVLKNNDSEYPINNKEYEHILINFKKIILSNIKEEQKLDEATKLLIIEDCQNIRGATVEFANFGNEALLNLRKRITKGEGIEKHLKKDSSDLNKEMVKHILNDYVESKNYVIDFDKFDWSRIELFLIVTEIYFKKLETTKDMKIDPNDVVDWLNLLYVTPDDKYLTFEKKWRKYIKEDLRIANYLFE